MQRTMAKLTVMMVVALLSVSCSTNNDTEGLSAGAAGTDGVPAAGSDSAGEAEASLVEITAVEYAFQGVPDEVPVGTELRLFNAGERVHGMEVMFVAGETAPLSELVPPRGVPVGAAFALPGEGALTLRFPRDGPPVPGPITLDTPGRYVLYSTVSKGHDVEAWRELMAELERGPVLQPPSFPGEPDFARGMVADLIVQGEATESNVLDVLQADGRFDTFHDLLVNYAPPRFEGFMSRPDWNLTVLAPTDDVFEVLPDGVVEGLRNDPDVLTRVLQHHVVVEYLPSDDAVPGQVRTVIGRLEVSIGGGTIRFGDATVTEADIEASNGIIHAIDRLLVPEGTDVEDLASGDGG